MDADEFVSTTLIIKTCLELKKLTKKISIMVLPPLEWLICLRSSTKTIMNLSLGGFSLGSEFLGKNAYGCTFSSLSVRFERRAGGLEIAIRE